MNFISGPNAVAQALSLPAGTHISSSQLLGAGSDQITQIISLLSYVFFIVLIFYGQRIQMYVMIREVENSLHKLKHIKEEGRKTTIEAIKEIGTS